MFHTTYFAQAKKLDPTANLVSIAIKTPQGFPGRSYPDLAPAWYMLEEVKKTGNEEMFKRSFLEKLSRLDVHKVAQDLGEGAILICYEGRGKFCHRHLVADWLRQGGYQVFELDW